MIAEDLTHVVKRLACPLLAGRFITLCIHVLRVYVCFVCLCPGSHGGNTNRFSCVWWPWDWLNLRGETTELQQ